MALVAKTVGHPLKHNAVISNMTNKLDLIKILVAKFRLAIEQTDKNKLTGSCINFPNGSCDDVSILLAKYLMENGFFDINLIKGGFDNKSHNWLEVENYVVDITADQFEFTESYIVASNSDWHNQLIIHSRIKPNIDNYDNHTRHLFLEAYDAIINNLSN